MFTTIIIILDYKGLFIPLSVQFISYPSGLLPFHRTKYEDLLTFAFLEEIKHFKICSLDANLFYVVNLIGFHAPKLKQL